MPRYPTSQLKTSLDKAQHILILLPENPTLDHLAAGLGLHLSIGKTTPQKQLQIVCPTDITVEYNRLIGVDQITNQLAGQNLVITLPYSHDQIEKVYTEPHSASGQLQVVIEPRPATPPINTQTINYHYQGSKADMIFFIGFHQLTELAHLATEVQESLNSTSIITINYRQPPEPSLPTHLHLIDEQAAALCEIIFHFLQDSGYWLDEDITTNLLAGIEHQTHNLTQLHTSPETLETVVACLRLGAVRGYTRPSGGTEKPTIATEVAHPLPSSAPPPPEETPNGQTSAPAPAAQLPPWMTPKIFTQ